MVQLTVSSANAIGFGLVRLNITTTSLRLGIWFSFQTWLSPRAATKASASGIRSMSASTMSSSILALIMSPFESQIACMRESSDMILSAIFQHELVHASIHGHLKLYWVIMYKSG